MTSASRRGPRDDRPSDLTHQRISALYRYRLPQSAARAGTDPARSPNEARPKSAVESVAAIAPFIPQDPPSHVLMPATNVRAARQTGAHYGQIGTVLSTGRYARQRNLDILSRNAATVIWIGA